MGRFGLGKYMPPDRSNEILPTEKTHESSATVSDSVKDVSDNANDKSSIIKAVTECSSIGNGSKYIRDAERFTELTTTPSACNAGSKIAQPDIIPTLQQAASNPDSAAVKENPMLVKSQEIDLD